jgi:hypothetical protein
VTGKVIAAATSKIALNIFESPFLFQQLYHFRHADITFFFQKTPPPYGMGAALECLPKTIKSPVLP